MDKTKQCEQESHLLLTPILAITSTCLEDLLQFCVGSCTPLLDSVSSWQLRLPYVTLMTPWAPLLKTQHQYLTGSY